MSNSKHTILVTGATGAIGPQVVEALAAADYCVRVFARRPPSPGLFPAVDVRLGDITNAKEVSAAVGGVDVVVHLAALLHIVNPSPTLHPEYQRVNVEGTAHLVEAARNSGVQRFVFASTINVYGESNGQILTEATPPKPLTCYAQTKLAAEQLVLQAHQANGAPLGVVLRLGAVYGPRIKGNYQQLLQLLARQRFLPIGRGDNRRTLLYDKDVAQAILLAVQHPNALGQVFNVSDGNCHRVDHIIEAMCGALHQRPPRFALPVKPMRYAAGILEDIGALVGHQSPIVRATIDKYTEDIAVSSKYIQEQLHFSPQYNLRQGWQETVEEMRRLHLL